MTKTNKLSSWNYIWQLAWPVMISNVAIPLVGVTDVAMMAHMPSPQYVAGVSLGMLVFNFIFAGFSFLRMCTTGFTAQAYGKEDTSEITLILLRGLSISIVSGIALIFLLPLIILLTDYFLTKSYETKQYMEDYLNIRIWGIPFSLSNFAIIGWIFGLQKMKIVMRLILIINLSNIVLNFIFVLGFSMEIKGVAIASVFAEIIGTIYIILLFIFKRLNLVSKNINFRSFFYKNNWFLFFKTGGNLIIRSFIIWSVEAILLSNASNLGDLKLAALQTILVILGLIAFTLDGFAHATEALVGNAIGKNRRDLLKIIILRSTILSFLTALFISLILIFFKLEIINILTNQFLLHKEISNIWIWCSILPISSFLAFQMDGVFVGAACAKSMRNAMIISLLIFITLILNFGELTIDKLLIAINIFLIMRGVILLILLPIVKKQIIEEKNVKV